MNLISQMHFLRPAWLLLIPICATLLWLFWRRFSLSTQWEGQCDPALLRALLVGTGAGKQWIPLAGLCSLWLIAVVALAGPTWEQQPRPVFSKLQSRILIFDLSQSMDSKDVAPSRLERARFKLTDLISGAGSRQQSLIVFAGDAFVVSPFTDDSKTLINLVPALGTQTVPVQGSRADKALKLAGELIENAGVSKVEIILLTDGVNSSSEKIASDLAASGHRVSILAIGTAQGAPVPLKNGELLKDASGSIVIPGVDHAALKRLASTGAGSYRPISVDDSDVRFFNHDQIPSLSIDFNAGEQTDLMSDTWIDKGIWLLFPLLLLSAFSFRRGWIICLALLLYQPDQAAHAFTWNDLWVRPDQQAATALTKQNPALVPERAAPDWRGAAAYRQGDHSKAAELFETLDTATSHYNRANALAKAGDLKRSITAYDKALSLQPDMEDAKFNRDIVEQLLNEQQSSSDQQQSDQNKSDQAEQEEKEGGDNSGSEGRPEDDSETAGRPDSDTASQNSPNQDQDSGRDTEQPLGNQQEEQVNSKPSPETEGTQSGAEGEMTPMDETQQALEQWLKQVPDDPGGLLRRKFRYQYSLRPEQTEETQKW